MIHYKRFQSTEGIASTTQMPPEPPAKGAKDAKVPSACSPFGRKSSPPSAAIDSRRPEAGHTYCPGCQSTRLKETPERTTCPRCAAYWLPSIDLACDAPTATIRHQHPDGHELLIGVYRCPTCRETRWGPRLDEQNVWCCLTGAGLR